MNFILGCNYWASHAGSDMWRNWDEEVIHRDLKILKENGIAYLRVFPNWRDFQPVVPLYGGGGFLYEYRMEGDLFPTNPYFIDEIMLDRFTKFCDIAQENGIQLIVGLLTGWMSGRLFIPAVLYEKNLYSDSTALLFEQKFVHGFVKRMKNHPAINAWDLGNECNVLSTAGSREEAFSWSTIISNAIRAVDSSRLIISGMHSLEIEGIWNITDQSEVTDILTTHPYPYWVPHCSNDKIDSIRTLLHGTIESIYYSAIGGKPCLVEELGTMGPMVCNQKVTADFMRVNLFSNWANGACGVMWWCANEQSYLDIPPYSWNMCERELGMLDNQQHPKPMLLELKKFSKFLDQFGINLPKHKIDAVCILTKNQDQWGIAFMTAILATQAGINLTFCYSEQLLPDADVYLLPSIHGNQVMSKERYDVLKQKVREGATLYLSMDDGFLTEFEEVTGVIVDYNEIVEENGQVRFEETTLDFRRTRRYTVSCSTAKTLVSDNLGIPALTVNEYGQGKVYYLNFPLEKMLLPENNAFEKMFYKIYQCFFSDILNEKLVKTDNPFIGITEHADEERIYVVLVNYSSKQQSIDLQLNNGYKISRVIYGTMENINACDASVFEIVPK